MELESNWIHELKVSVEELPIEHEHKVPNEIIFTFTTNELKEDRLVQSDVFNDLGENIVRESDNDDVRVKNNDDLIDKFNRYRYSDVPNDLSGCVLSFLTLGCYYWSKRRVIKAGNFGHFSSVGRHMLCRAGITAQLPVKNSWAWPNLIPMDMESEADREGKTRIEVIKRLGSKTILTVQENCIGGAYRIGTCNLFEKQYVGTVDGETKEEYARDGEYVLFPQGRYILQETEYGTTNPRQTMWGQKGQIADVVNPRIVTVKNLVTDRVDNKIKLGPITIAFIKEGFIGGAYRIYTGKYEVFPPGPPYLLHEEEWENIEIRERTRNVFSVGPITFVTVPDGKMAGAYDKHNGRYIILPPGQTYKLDKKDYQYDTMVDRTEHFKLGPYRFLTVKKFMLSGVYEKKGGRFIILPPGYTYQLSDENFEKPVTVVNNKHRVDIGPLTYLTLEDGKISGAYRLKDGKFHIFEDNSVEHLLHSTEYHSLQTIKKYDYKMASFGPFKIITVPEGYYGVFMREGILEVKPPKFYRLTADYTILDQIPKFVQTNPMKNIQFKAKDGVAMDVDGAIIWKIHHVPIDQVTEDNPDGVKQVSLYPGGFKQVQYDLVERCKIFLRALSKRYNRNRLLPTKQDVMIRTRKMIREGLLEEGKDTDDLWQEMMGDDAKLALEVQHHVEREVQQKLEVASRASSWGVQILAVKIHEYTLKNRKIMTSLNEITEIALSKDLVKIKGELEMAKAEAERLASTKKAEASSEANQKRAIARAEVDKIAALAKAEVKEVLAKAKADADVLTARMEGEAKVLRAEAKAQANAKQREIVLDVNNEKIRRTAHAQSTKIKLIAEAQYQKKLRENKAAGLMTDKQFKLKLIEKNVESMRRMGDSAWRMPDKYMKYYNEFAPMVKIPKA